MTRFDGLEEHTYTITWTKNGKGWHTAAFETRDEAREFVAGMIRENEGNLGFSWYAQRMATLASADFLDDAVQDVMVRFANPWLCASNGENEVRDVPKEGEGKRGPDIPRTVNVLGLTYRVERGGTEPDEDGACSPSKLLISIREGLCREKEEQVFLHELVHAILTGLAYDEQYEDERLVQGLAIGLHQALFVPTSSA